MKERILELQERVQGVRSALDAMAGRAAKLRGKLAVLQSEQALTNGQESPAPPPGPVPGSLAHSLERLTVLGTASDMGDGDDGRFVSDAWEIALINEEGK